MKIVIFADMEGISTVVSMKQVNPGTKEYERARRQMTGEVNIAIHAAFDYGTKEIQKLGSTCKIPDKMVV